ncbi:ABC1 family-domain-containing protein [Flammula alnicola]|nr:ABC1 family-domain-containing protein [Flammula alnicola]
MLKLYLQSLTCLSKSSPWKNTARHPFSRRFSTNSEPLKGSTLETPIQPPRRLRKYARRTGYLLLGLGTVYAVDKTYNASAIFRNLRTLHTCAMITLDYKWNFTPEKSDLIPQLHERVAQRVYDLMTSNGGLYIKIGQAIGANAAVLPKPMQVKFASLFDDAPQIPYSVVHDVFVKELGRPPSGPGGVFEIFEEQAVASASIAQVHKAKLWPTIGPDGQPETEERWVAVKVQKPDVSTQMEWDLGAYRAVMWMFENWAFDLPVYFVVDFVSDHLRQELDFIREADNARQTAEFVANEPLLRDKVYIPKVYPEYSTKKVMIAEWIDGVRLSDKAGIFRLMGESPPTGSPTSSSETPLDPFAATSLVASPPNSPVSSLQMPAKPLKGGVKAVMQTMVELFSAQMFEWGWVHCDPHPGNVLVRPSPSNPSRPQLVLLDHGLYVRVPEDFKRDWVRLWRAMLVGDYNGVDAVTKGWGFGLPELMASFTLMRPTILRNGRKTSEDGGKPKERQPLTQYEMSVRMKQKLKEFLMDTDRMPKVLIFLTRNMRMVQGSSFLLFSFTFLSTLSFLSSPSTGNNQSFGSPVNRIKVTGFWASRSQVRNTNLPFVERVKEWWHHLTFQAAMLHLDLIFWKSRFFSWLRNLRAHFHLGVVSAKGAAGFEEEIEKSVRTFAKDNLGIDVGDTAFAG